jgi:uncharacterized membrane protein (UPF0182 family)
MRVFEFPTGVNIDGPAQVRSQINQDATVSQQITLLSQRESQVLYGDLIVVPIEDSFLYVQPLFVVAASETPIPQLTRVIIVRDGAVTLANTLPEALAVAFGQQPEPEPPPEGEQPTATVQELIAQALQHFQRADQALREGDLATYQAEIRRAQELIAQANELGQGGATPTPSPTPSP